MRYKLDKDEFCQINFEQLILNDCHGIGLNRRGDNDPHVMFTMLCEDDGQWFENRGESDCYWMLGQVEVLQAAMQWIEANCDPHIPTVSGWPENQPSGWDFRD